MVSNEEREKQERAKLEEIGVEAVKIALTSNTLLPLTDRGVAWRWLRDKEQENRLAEENFRLSEERLAGKIFIYTVIAAVAGTIAAIASVIALFK
jgi:hypothetical protein